MAKINHYLAVDQRSLDRTYAALCGRKAVLYKNGTHVPGDVSCESCSRKLSTNANGEADHPR